MRNFVRIFVIIVLAVLLSSCAPAMVLKTERIESDGTKFKVTVKSKRTYKNFELNADLAKKILIIKATDVKTGPDAWAPVVGKLLDKLPDVKE